MAATHLMGVWLQLASDGLGALQVVDSRATLLEAAQRCTTLVA